MSAPTPASRPAPCRLPGPVSLLFGPLFLKEVIVLGRRPATYWIRFGYVLLLAAVLTSAYLGLMEVVQNSGPAARLQGLSHMAPQLAKTIGWLQFIVLTLAGVVLTATTISEERFKGTLPALFTTPLSAAQIVFGKLSSRLLQAVILGLVAVPVLLFLRAFGGFEAEIAVAFSAVSICSAMFTASVGLLLSVFQKRAWTVVILGQIITVAAYVLPALIGFTLTWSDPVEAERLFLKLMYVLPPFALAAMTDPNEFAGLLGFNPTGAWVSVCIILVTVSILLNCFSAAALRAVVLARSSGRSEPLEDDGSDADQTETPGTTGLPPRAARRRRRRGGVLGAREGRSRIVGDRPVLWRELRTSVIGSRLVAGILGVLVVAYFGWTYWQFKSTETAIHYLIAMPLVPIQLLGACMTTAALIPAERDARTWDVLLTTPLSAREIVLSKCAGGVFKLCLIPALLVCHFGVFAFAGSVLWLTVLHLTMLLFSHTFLIAAIGVLLGLKFRRPVAANMVGILIALALWAGLPAVIGLLLTIGGNPDDSILLQAAMFINPVFLTVQAISGGIAEAAGSGRGYWWFNHNFMSAGSFSALLASSCTLIVCAGIGCLAAAVALLRAQSARKL